MARRRNVAPSPAAPAQAWTTHDPATAAREWGAQPLPCDRADIGLPCAITGGVHDEWCPVFALRRHLTTGG